MQAYVAYVLWLLGPTRFSTRLRCLAGRIVLPAACQRCRLSGFGQVGHVRARRAGGRAAKQL
eukprot:11160135-Lingulodinium_polyedra.AAC.1